MILKDGGEFLYVVASSETRRLKASKFLYFTQLLTVFVSHAAGVCRRFTGQLGGDLRFQPRSLAWRQKLLIS